MRFLIKKSSNSFGDLILEVYDLNKNKSELFLEHETNWKKAYTDAKITKFSGKQAIDLIKAFNLIQLIKSNPIDKKLLKEELKAIDSDLVKIAKKISKIEYYQTRINIFYHLKDSLK